MRIEGWLLENQQVGYLKEQAGLEITISVVYTGCVSIFDIQ